MVFIKKNILYLCWSLLAIFAFTKSFAQNEKMNEKVVSIINKHRTSLGLQELKMDTQINEIALQHSKNMASGKTAFGHNGFDDRMKIISKKLPVINHMSENVAYGDIDAAGIFDLWLHSPGHRKNMEGKFNYTGIGIAKAKNGDVYVTMIYVYRK